MSWVVTRDVVSDLWPLYRSGEASADSTTLVEAFLADDKDYAATLEESMNVKQAIPALQLSPVAERQMLDDARERARMKLLLIGGSIGLVAFLSIVALGAVIYMVVARSG